MVLTRRTYVTDVRELWDKLTPQSDDPVDGLDLDPDRDGDVEPVVHADEEFEEKTMWQ